MSKFKAAFEFYLNCSIGIAVILIVWIFLDHQLNLIINDRHIKYLRAFPNKCYESPDTEKMRSYKKKYEEELWNNARIVPCR